jgi:hypothetical protein
VNYNTNETTTKPKSAGLQAIWRQGPCLFSLFPNSQYSPWSTWGIHHLLASLLNTLTSSEQLDIQRYSDSATILSSVILSLTHRWRSRSRHLT